MTDPIEDPNSGSTQDACDRGRLAAFIAGQLKPPDDDDLLKHLENCVSCRESLEAQAAAPEAWNEMALLLTPGKFDHATSLGFSTASVVGLSPGGHISQEAVLKLLSPSEQPDSLGLWSQYDITEVVGAGGMGVVLKGIDPLLHRDVAIKVLAPQLALSETARRRFSREAQSAAAVEHNHVVGIFSVDEFRNLPFLVMPYIKGGSLRDKLKSEGPLSITRTLEIAAQIAEGLAAAHETGLVHRDIKPANILLESDSDTANIFLTDFGLARAVDDVSLTRQGAIAGTPEFMSPEQAIGKPVTQATDLFSLGGVIYAMCTGRPPFTAENSMAMLNAVIEHTPKSICELNPKIPAWLEGIVFKLMQKSPEDRFESAASVVSMLRQCQSHVETSGHADLPASVIAIGTEYKKQRSKKLRSQTVSAGKMLKLGICVLLLTTIGFTVWSLLNTGNSERLNSATLASETTGQLNSENINNPTGEPTPRQSINELKVEQSEPRTLIKLGGSFPDLQAQRWVGSEEEPQLIEPEKVSVIHVWSAYDARRFIAFQHWAVFNGFHESKVVGLCLIPDNQSSTVVGERIKKDLNAAQEYYGFRFPVAVGLVGDKKEEFPLVQTAIRDLLTKQPLSTPYSMIIDANNRLVWIGSPERLRKVDELAQESRRSGVLLESAQNDCNTIQNYQETYQRGNWDAAIKLLPQVRKIDASVPSNLEYAKFRLSIDSAGKTGAFSKVDELASMYPRQPELLLKVTDKLIRLILDETFETGFALRNRIQTAMKLAKHCVTITHESDADSLATLARVCYANEDIRSAIDFQKRAVSVCRPSDLNRHKSVLDQFQAILSVSK